MELSPSKSENPFTCKPYFVDNSVEKVDNPLSAQRIMSNNQSLDFFSLQANCKQIFVTAWIKNAKKNEKKKRVETAIVLHHAFL